MLTRRIVPCLDVKNGRTVKGTNFVGLKDAGDPVELAEKYAKDGADEIVFLDISATHEERKTFAEMVQRIAEVIDVPFTVGGGISTVEDVGRLLEAGADKVSINTSAVKNPAILTNSAERFGSQCVVLSVDARREGETWFVHLNGGRVPTKLNALEWVRRGVELGAGEVLLTSINADGTKGGFDVELTRRASELVPVPVIASGGAGSMDDFADVFVLGRADAALAASVFHFGEMSISGLKSFLNMRGLTVRI